jgi:hypothetical protein
MDALWVALQESFFAAFVRDSVYLYPFANITHVVAVIAFFGLVAVMDLRLLGVFGGTPGKIIIARLRPLAFILFIVIATTGFVLFSAEAVALARNPAFQIKLAAIALALANIAMNEWTMRSYGEAAPLARVTAGLSLAVWLFIATMGRTIAYV